MTRALRCFGLLAAWCSSAAWAAQEPPKWAVVLAPVASQERIERLNVRLNLGDLRVGAGQALLRMPVVLVGTPMAGYGAADIAARDDQGELRLSVKDEAPTPSGTFRKWLVSRATVGPVRVSYGAAPRVVNRETRMGPLFDLRAEAGGVIGSGHYFLALPPDEIKRSVSLKWDLSGLPTGWRGVWSLGEGDQTALLTPDDLAGSFFAAGPVKSYPHQASGPFGLYWLSEPPFDAREVAQHIQALYRHMAQFFKDTDGTYRVFIRANPHPGSGGTALSRTFMFGYDSADGKAIQGLEMQMLLAHEMTHNWPVLEEEDPALVSWYNEGMAEYYSILLSLRAGVIDLKQFERIINSKAKDYYTNPFVEKSSEEVGKLYWQSADAQSAPYGRGFMYLAKVNAQIKARTGGRKSLDDVAVGLHQQRLAGKKVGNADWLAAVQEILGIEARKDFAAMMAGRRIAVPAESFGPCFKHVPQPEQPIVMGFDRMRGAVVSDLDPNSAAAKAGLREGDAIVKQTPYAELTQDPTRKMVMTVSREGVERVVTFLPRTAAVPSGRWLRQPQVPARECGLWAAAAVAAPAGRYGAVLVPSPVDVAASALERRLNIRRHLLGRVLGRIAL
ncbi:MAG: hypothetical protein U5L74_06890 [Ideonella sp.]|nr:hypothetical protein [Ideonella sp.]